MVIVPKIIIVCSKARNSLDILVVIETAVRRRSLSLIHNINSSSITLKIECHDQQGHSAGKAEPGAKDQ